MSLFVTINGQSRTFAKLTPPATLAELIAELNLKGDRIAVEHNGEIAPRTNWADVAVNSGDRLEVVHFVGGGFAKVRGMADSADSNAGFFSPGANYT